MEGTKQLFPSGCAELSAVSLRTYVSHSPLLAAFYQQATFLERWDETDRKLCTAIIPTQRRPITAEAVLVTFLTAP
jgi:hypothetical protein